MHSLRSSLRAREEGAPARPLSLEERRREAPVAQTPELPKGERRTGAQRRAERHRGVVERAAILYRGKRAMVAVGNVSKGGVTIETALTPEIGETLLLELPGKTPAEARVRWVKPGRVGLALAG
ncbi:MAG TPA: PilZ domain-containing protein [Allosphingosinicella sp.]|nr:PilZ domain-containing protein [Allosphingosinicella sp.]